LVFTLQNDRHRVARRGFARVVDRDDAVFEFDAFRLFDERVFARNRRACFRPTAVRTFAPLDLVKSDRAADWLASSRAAIKSLSAVLSCASVTSESLKLDAGNPAIIF